MNEKEIYYEPTPHEKRINIVYHLFKYTMYLIAIGFFSFISNGLLGPIFLFIFWNISQEYHDIEQQRIKKYYVRKEEYFRILDKYSEITKSK